LIDKDLYGPHERGVVTRGAAVAEPIPLRAKYNSESEGGNRVPTRPIMNKPKMITLILHSLERTAGVTPT
jgi:hypothetical protein